MNKSFSQLVELATEIDPNALEGAFGPGVFNKEKFAELIVRKCIRMIENEASQYAEPTWAFELVNDIKETFGVEE